MLCGTVFKTQKLQPHSSRKQSKEGIEMCSIEFLQGLGVFKPPNSSFFRFFVDLGRLPRPRSWKIWKNEEFAFWRLFGQSNGKTQDFLHFFGLSTVEKT